jgi:NADPH-dependent ferric siderophore reductase/DNA-binding PadR family transcriptional regulator
LRQDKHKGHRHRGGHGGGHGRRKRLYDYGELRLLVLNMISEQPRHGYELIKLIEEQTDGAYAPSPGVIYPTLSWLEDMGYVTIETSQGGRKLSHITEEGSTLLAANKDAVATLLTRKPPQGRAGATKEIVEAMDTLKDAMRLRFANGTEEAPVVAAQILDLAKTIASEAKTETAIPESVITRHRHDTRRRELTVKETAYLTPHMIRMVLTGDELHDFVSLGADDHVKLFFPSGGEKPLMRDYTPRAYDTEACTLTLDFAVHEAGPATAWALQAKVGDALTIGGPRGSAVIAPVFDWWLLIGDETALPAIGRRVEELAEGAQVITIAAIPGAEDAQNFDTQAELTQHWVHRPVEQAADPAALLEAAKALTLPEGNGFVWIAAEAQVARALKAHFTEDRGHPGNWVKSAGYWTDGTAGESDKSMS